MTTIDTRYSAVLPVQNDIVEESFDITAHAQITAKQSYTSGHSLESIDWSSVNQTPSHQMITIDSSINRASGESLDSLANSILAHIGSRISS